MAMLNYCVLFSPDLLFIDLMISQVIPLVRVLMRKRTTAAYRAALEKLKSLAPRFKPSQIMTDYERGEQKALEEAFPNAELHGCLFHYAKVRSVTSILCSNCFICKITPNYCFYVFTGHRR